ncbi:helix-turn-helix domain-containing protein [Thermoleptolyngbya sp.]
MAEFVEKFSLLLSPEEEKRLHQWLETCRKVWNLALNALQELDQSTSINRIPAQWGESDCGSEPSCGGLCARRVCCTDQALRGRTRAKLEH